MRKSRFSEEQIVAVLEESETGITCNVATASTNSQQCVYRIEQTVLPRTLHDALMDNETIRLKHVLKSHLKAIMEADHLYWSETAHSREDVCEYQKRQARLKELRLEIATLTQEYPMLSEAER